MCELASAFRTFSQPEKDPIFLTEVLEPHVERVHSQEMINVKRKDLKVILENEVFKVILREEIPSNGNIFPGHLVLAIRPTEGGRIKYKESYVIGGHRDSMENLLMHTSTTL